MSRITNRILAAILVLLVLILLAVFFLFARQTEQRTIAASAESRKVLPLPPIAPVQVLPQPTTIRIPEALKVPVPFTSFKVYRDKSDWYTFYPSGYMPDGKCISVDDAWQKDPQEGKTCIRIVYDIECSKASIRWAGVYWQHPANNWGERRGGYNLVGATKLTFWARGELGGERIEEFGIGGIGTGGGGRALFVDSDAASIGPVILPAEWRKYTIDLRGRDLSSISGGFFWAANTDFNPHHCTFYLDDIRFE